MLHRLAVVFGVPVAEIDISLDEFVDWMAYQSIEPFAMDRSEYMLAQLSHVSAAAHAKRPPKVEEFMMTHQLAKQHQRTTMTFEDSVRAAFGAPPRKK